MGSLRTSLSKDREGHDKEHVLGPSKHSHSTELRCAVKRCCCERVMGNSLIATTSNELWIEVLKAAVYGGRLNST